MIKRETPYGIPHNERYYDPPEFYENEDEDDRYDDGDYAYDKWKDEQAEKRANDEA